MRTEDHVDPGGAIHDCGAIFLSEAATDRDLHARALSLDCRQLAQIAVEFIVGVFAYRTRVENDNIYFAVLNLVLVSSHISGFFEHSRQSLGVVDVHLAAECAHLICAWRRSEERRVGKEWCARWRTTR